MFLGKRTNKSFVNPHILLLYVYANTQPHSYGNLKYFIENAVRENDGVDYYFILQQVQNKPINESEMPQLPKSNAHYIQHENKCFDFGTFGWFIDQYTIGNPWKKQTSVMINTSDYQQLNLTQYKYFILMNSSIRGPFFPPYFQKFLLESKDLFHWYSIFTHRLNEKIKLVGITINCHIVPHIQSYLLVTDFIGLSIMLKPGISGGTQVEGIFGCYPTKDHATFYSELPSSNRMIDSGYMIDCILTKYQTVNFSEPRNRQCNKNLNPYFDNNLDGTSLEPYEVVFVKFSDLPYLQESRRRAELYQRWMDGIKQNNRSHW